MTRALSRSTLATPCAAALALVTACEPAADPRTLSRALASVMATCSSTSGEVQVRRKDEAFWTGVATGALFQPGDWVRTDRASHARVEFRSGGALDLEDDALVVIEAVEVAPVAGGPADQPIDGALAQALVEVKKGVVRGTLAPHTEHRRPPALVVKTADGSRVRLGRTGAGEVEIKLSRNADRTEISVSKGEATVAYADKKEEIFTTGRAAQVAGGTMDAIEPIAGPAPVRPAADARLFAAASAELTWSKMPNAKGYQVQLANDAAFMDGLQTIEATGERSLLEPRGPGVTYFRVAARDAAGRLWDFGPPRRVFFEKDTPKDLLTAPADKATFGYPGAPPRILFSWAPMEGARSYRLLVASGDDFAHPLVSEVTTSAQVVVETLTPGVYRWGVWSVDDTPRPLFLAPRSLTIVKVAALRAPRVITKWGDK